MQTNSRSKTIGNGPHLLPPGNSASAAVASCWSNAISAPGPSTNMLNLAEVPLAKMDSDSVRNAAASLVIKESRKCCAIYIYMCYLSPIAYTQINVQISLL